MPRLNIVYENQLLGAFIYALGYEAGRQGLAMAGVNQFQQTPVDGSFGDLIVGTDSCVALEFKRSIREVSTEAKKWPSYSLQALREDQDAQAVGAQAHFLVYGLHHEAGFDMVGLRYFQALRPASPEMKPFKIQGLIQSLLCVHTERTGRPVGVPPAILQSYLLKLRRWRSESKGGREKGSSVWLAVARTSAGLRFLTAESLQLLLDKERDKERTMDRGYDRG